MGKRHNQMTKQQQQQMMQRNQKKVQQAVKAVSNKKYVAQTKDMTIAIKMDESGRIDENGCPQIELTNSLEFLDQKTKNIVQDAVYQFMLCINQVVEQRSSDFNKNVGIVVKEVVKDLEEAQQSA